MSQVRYTYKVFKKKSSGEGQALGCGGWRLAPVSPSLASTSRLRPTRGALIPSPSAETTHSSTLAVSLSIEGRLSIRLPAYLSNCMYGCVYVFLGARERSALCSCLGRAGEGLADPQSLLEPPTASRALAGGEGGRRSGGGEPRSCREAWTLGLEFLTSRVVCERAGDGRRDSHRENMSPCPRRLCLCLQ